MKNKLSRLNSGILLTIIFIIQISTGRAQSKVNIEELLSKMTLEEKIGQMAQINITMIMTDSVFRTYDSVTVFKLDTNN